MDNETAKNIRESLTADCTKCFGLCCTALNIVASSDFQLTSQQVHLVLIYNLIMVVKFTATYKRKVLRAVQCLTV